MTIVIDRGKYWGSSSLVVAKHLERCLAPHRSIPSVTQLGRRRQRPPYGCSSSANSSISSLVTSYTTQWGLHLQKGNLTTTKPTMCAKIKSKAFKRKRIGNYHKFDCYVRRLGADSQWVGIEQRRWYVQMDSCVRHKGHAQKRKHFTSSRAPQLQNSLSACTQHLHESTGPPRRVRYWKD